MKKINEKLTVTIGIPAYNEEANIKNMLESVLKQKEESFILERILVVLDGCTDNTLKIVISIAKKDKRIKIINDGKRTGKATRLNKILEMNKSDFIFFIDADIALERNIELEEMILEFINNKKVNVVAGYQIPTHANSFMEKISNSAFKLWYDTTTSVNEGNHIYNLHGSISGMRNSFARSLTFPSALTCDQGYLYMKSISNDREGFKLAKNTRFIFRTASTIKDSRLQGTRSIFKDKEQMRKYFGKEVMAKEYAIPFRNKIISLMKFLIKDPMYTILAISLGIFIRKFSLKDDLNKKGVWKVASSSKKGISINY